MQVDIYSIYSHALERRLRDRVVVVIDVLRASTTIVEAMANGAKCIIPANNIEDALAICKAKGEEDTLLAGEREGKKIEGCMLGNSPLDFSAMVVQSKTVVLTTTNGTNALNHVRNSDTIIIGALRNKSAVCKYIVETGKDVALICAGTDGQFSADDIYCSGGFLATLRSLEQNVETSDLGKVAEYYYLGAKKDRSLLACTSHYKYLISIGASMDIEYCMEEDACDIIPRLVNGIIELQ